MQLGGVSSNIQRSITGSGVRKSDGMTFECLMVYFVGGWGCIEVPVCVRQVVVQGGVVLL